MKDLFAETMIQTFRASVRSPPKAAKAKNVWIFAQEIFPAPARRALFLIQYLLLLCFHELATASFHFRFSVRIVSRRSKGEVCYVVEISEKRGMFESCVEAGFRSFLAVESLRDVIEKGATIYKECRFILFCNLHSASFLLQSSF